MDKENKGIEWAVGDLTVEESSALLQKSIETGEPFPYTVADMWPVNMIKKVD